MLYEAEIPQMIIYGYLYVHAALSGLVAGPYTGLVLKRLDSMCAPVFMNSVYLVRNGVYILPVTGLFSMKKVMDIADNQMWSTKPLNWSIDFLSLVT